MGTSQYISLKDAALMTERSQQTIRRLIKANKVKYRKYKTPQGFTYLVEKSSLILHFQEADELDEAELVEDFDMNESDDEVYLPAQPSTPTHPTRPPRAEPNHGPMPGYAPPSHQPYGSPSMGYWPTHEAPPPPPAPEPAPMPHATAQAAPNTVINELIRQHRDDKNRLFELLETFQKRILTLEEHIRLLEAPKPHMSKKWYHFWK